MLVHLNNERKYLLSLTENGPEHGPKHVAVTNKSDVNN
jgi:hypothetical protein